MRTFSESEQLKNRPKSGNNSEKLRVIEISSFSINLMSTSSKSIITASYKNLYIGILVEKPIYWNSSRVRKKFYHKKF